MNCWCAGPGAGLVLSPTGRVTGAESDGRFRSVTTAELELELELISPAVDTVEETVAGEDVRTVVVVVVVDGLERSGKMLSLSELEVELISPAVDTVEVTVPGETVVDGLERSGKMLSLSVSKLSLELGGISVLMSVPVMLTVVAGVRVAGSGLGLLVVGLVVV